MINIEGYMSRPYERYRKLIKPNIERSLKNSNIVGEKALEKEIEMRS